MANATPRFSSVRDLIEACGGMSAVARRLGITTAAVSLWVAKERLPPARVLPMQRLLATLAIEAMPDDLWALTSVGLVSEQVAA